MDEFHKYTLGKVFAVNLKIYILWKKLITIQKLIIAFQWHSFGEFILSWLNMFEIFYEEHF